MPLKVGLHSVSTRAQFDDLAATALAEKKRLVAVVGERGFTIRVVSGHNFLTKLANHITGQTERENQQLESFKNALSAAQEQVEPRPLRDRQPSIITPPIEPHADTHVDESQSDMKFETPHATEALTAEEIAAQKNLIKESLHYFGNALGEMLMSNDWYISEIGKKTERFRQHLMWIDKGEEFDTEPHMLILAERISPYEDFLAGQLVAMGLIQSREDMWGISNADIVEWYQRCKESRTPDPLPPIEPEHIEPAPVEPDVVEPVVTPIATPLVEAQPLSQHEALAGAVFKAVFGADTPFTQNTDDVLALIKKKGILKGMCERDQEVHQLPKIRQMLNKGTPVEFKNSLSKLQSLQQQIKQGVYIERQFGTYCGKHSLASFFGHGFFATEQSFLKTKSDIVLRKNDGADNPFLFDLNDIGADTDTFMMQNLLDQLCSLAPAEMPAHMRNQKSFSYFVNGPKRFKKKNDSPAENQRVRDLKSRDALRVKSSCRQLIEKMNASPFPAFILGNSYHWFTVKKINDEWRVLDSMNPDNTPPLDLETILRGLEGTSLNILGLEDSTKQWQIGIDRDAIA